MWYILLRNIRLISSIKQDHRTDAIRIVHPALQLFLCDRRTGRIVREAQVNQIRCLLRKIRSKPIVRGTWHVDNITPALRQRIIASGTPCHYIGIHIHRIDRIANCNLIIQAENLLNISGITFCTV